MTIERKVGIAYSIRFTVGAVLYSVGVLVGLRWAVVVRLGDFFWRRSPAYQAALYGYGMHTFSHLGSAALARRYTPGVATALPVVLPFWIFAKRTLRAHGLEVRPHRWVIPAFPVIAGTALGSAYLMTTGRSRERRRDGK